MGITEAVKGEGRTIRTDAISLARWVVTFYEERIKEQCIAIKEVEGLRGDDEKHNCSNPTKILFNLDALKEQE